VAGVVSMDYVSLSFNLILKHAIKMLRRFL
jgi:hypothetical protein